MGEWLKRKFAGCNVVDQFDFPGTSQFYRIDEDGKVRHRVLVSREFFDDHSIEQITRLLDEWRADDHIRKAGPRRVIVSHSGPSIQA